MVKMLEDKDWRILLERIDDGKCTPFLGAGMCYGVLPLGGDVARQWAKEYDYPLDDSSDLMRVAQFLALEQGDGAYPKEEILRMFEKKQPDFTDRYEPHRVLANLPLPVYLTTNYDNFMMEALKQRRKGPKREMCQWNNYVKRVPSIFKTDPDYVPSPANPVVFHLHGHDEIVDSLVLTEDDYLDFLVNLANDPDMLPPAIQSSLSGTSLLFIGYRIADLNLRTILRSISRYMEQGGRRISVATMMLPVDASDAARQEKAKQYLTKYYGNINVVVYWGTARDFLKELGTRWEERSKNA
jgi:hypothetical protein